MNIQIYYHLSHTFVKRVKNKARSNKPSPLLTQETIP